MDVKLNGVRAKMNPSALRLDAVDLGGKCGIVAQEIDGLAGRVDLRLIEVLALAEHACGVDDSAVLACEQVGYLQDDRGSYSPVQLRPLVMSVESGLDGHFNLLGTCLVICGEHVRVVMRHNHLSGVAGADLLAADNQRNVQLYAALSFKFGLEGYSLRGAFEV